MPRDPHEQGREHRRAEDDPERCPRQITARRHSRELAHDKLKVAFDRGKVAARLIGLPQCERVLLCHVHVIAERAYSIVKPFGRTPLGAAPGRMLGKAPSVFTKAQLFFPQLMPPANKPGKAD